MLVELSFAPTLIEMTWPPSMWPGGAVLLEFNIQLCGSEKTQKSASDLKRTVALHVWEGKPGSREITKAWKPHTHWEVLLSFDKSA